MKRSRLALSVALLPIAALVASCTSSDTTVGDGESQLETVLDRGHVIVGTGSDNAPWHFEKDGELVGGDVAMGHILADALFEDPDKVEFEQQSADSRIPNLESGKVDVVFQFMTITPARAQQVAFTAPYYTEGTGLLLPSGGEYKDYDEIESAVANGEEVNIGVLKNVNAEEIVEDVLPGANAKQFDAQADVYQAIDSNRVDGGAVDASNIQFRIQQEPDKWIDSGFTTYQQNYAGAVKQGDSTWLNYVDTIIVDAITGQSRELYSEMMEEYFGVDVPVPPLGVPGIYLPPVDEDNSSTTR